ncbi:MAG: protein translocase subunit SecF [Dethiobacter sp.]|nr:MAG: protein translocase subunit SecF [Dethiobacter sp.]
MIKFNFPFMEYRRSAFVLSGAIILIGIVSLLLNGLNLGIDFTGGTILHLRLAEEFRMEEVREVLSPFELQGVPLQRVGGNSVSGGREVIIKAPHLDEPVRREIISAFRERWPEMTSEDVMQVDNVGAVIGKELTREAFLALLIAVVAMVLYITMRFEFKFALAAILALLHDAFIVLAVFSIFKIEINSPFIAAILTIIGYSINDTIVIFDRIRENLKYHHKRTVKEVINDSINESLVRSINTSLTTLVVLISLFVAFNYFVGGMNLKVFALALLVGIITGTYSSIFIASPIWYLWRLAGDKKQKAPA